MAGMQVILTKERNQLDLEVMLGGVEWGIDKHFLESVVMKRLVTLADLKEEKKRKKKKTIEICYQALKWGGCRKPHCHSAKEGVYQAYCECC